MARSIGLLGLIAIVVPLIGFAGTGAAAAQDNFSFNVTFGAGTEFIKGARRTPGIPGVTVAFWSHTIAPTSLPPVSLALAQPVDANDQCAGIMEMFQSRVPINNGPGVPAYTKELELIIPSDEFGFATIRLPLEAPLHGLFTVPTVFVGGPFPTPSSGPPGINSPFWSNPTGRFPAPVRQAASALYRQVNGGALITPTIAATNGMNTWNDGASPANEVIFGPASQPRAYLVYEDSPAIWGVANMVQVGTSTSTALPIRVATGQSFRVSFDFDTISVIDCPDSGTLGEPLFDFGWRVVFDLTVGAAPATTTTTSMSATIFRVEVRPTVERYEDAFNNGSAPRAALLCTD